MKHKIVVIGTLYGLLVPVGVWAGVALDHNQWLLVIPLIVFNIAIQILSTYLWINVQTDEVKKI